MDPTDQTSQSSQENVAERGQVSSEKKSKKIVWIIIAIVIIAGIVGGVVYLLQTPEEAVIEDTPDVGTEQQTSEPTATPEPVDKSEVSIMILNGTGITGEAGILQEELEGLEYENIEVGNADETDHEITIVIFSPDLSDVIKDEILGELEDLYNEVQSETSELDDYDIEITTGLRAGQTPKPDVEGTSDSSDSDTEETPTPTPTPTAEPTESPVPDEE